MPATPGTSARKVINPSLSGQDADRVRIPINPISSSTVDPFFPLETGRVNTATGPSDELTSLTITGPSSLSGSTEGTYTATVAGTNVNTNAGVFLWEKQSGVGDITFTTATDIDTVNLVLPYSAEQTWTVRCTYTETGVTGSPVQGTININHTA